MTVAIILAAGKGTRMRSSLPKVAHRLAGVPLILHVHAAVLEMDDVTPLYVLGHGRDTVREMLPASVAAVVQEEQRGTGHAVAMALAALPSDTVEVMVLYGDMPLLTSDVLRALRDRHRASAAKLTLLSTKLGDPFGYGRVVRASDGTPQAIVEQKWLTPDQAAIDEVNTGVYVIDAGWLRRVLPILPQHADGEIYLTDLAEHAASEQALEVVPDAPTDEVLGINDRVSLAEAERIMRRRINRKLMLAGVTLIDPDATYIAADAAIGADSVIEPNVWIDTGVSIGSHCNIGANSRIVASGLGDHCTVLSSVIEYAELGDYVSVGPFSHLRAGTSLGQDVHIGNFAEVKNSSLGPQSRMGHFSYVGDADVGHGVNVGAGTVTANYDGKNKHRTIVGDNVFLGVGTLMRAPIELGARSVTGAGSVVLHDVPSGTVVAGVPARELRRPKNVDPIDEQSR